MSFDPIAALADRQREQLSQYAAELARVNKRFNLVAPSTLRYVERVHLRHSLALSWRPFPAGATVVDWGAGGGLPTVPLAIAFPETRFVAVDSVGKKMEAVRLFARRLGLENLDVWNGRAERYDGPLPHYAVSRATAPLATLWGWTERVRQPLAEVPAEAWTPGLYTLKGGDLTEEIAALPDGLAVETTPLTDILGPGDETKALVAVRPA
ncbi:MAG TPA: 16S rRNA (guanine(527)-N(7))-methyltransferase RsmG [Bacteroidetes bacterium]|nr:16S rRNA (guanine(527)-N(7))-methyltransferase RsmG [Bacteroidota bacterium]HIL58615.1 16S rRNA (guanine(527)-N(7))-methyltransferase RsmG [Rhodothermales bacterium]